MRDILPDLDDWRSHGLPIALATVVETWGSSPRQPGAKMALTRDGRITGSVSGGCVEGAVAEAGVESLDQGRGRLLHFGVADETAWEVGLACGGSLDVFVRPMAPDFFDAVRSALSEEQAAASVTVVNGPPELVGRELLVRDDGQVIGAIGGGLDDQAVEAGQAAIVSGQSRRRRLGEADVFVEALMPSPTLIVVGGVHITVALVSLARTLGYRAIVVDPRKAFGSEARFAHADQLIQKWPDEAFADLVINRSTAVAMLTHDPKLDDPALLVALRSPAFYVGALGSQKTQAKRRARLLAEGITEAELDRLYGPIGLDLAARTPEEIAMAIMAEVVAARNGRRLAPAG